MIASVNPFTGETLQVFEEFSPAEVERRLQAAQKAFGQHRTSKLHHRSAKLHKAAQILEDTSSRLAGIITDEMGKTLTSAEAEVKKCATACRFYADHGEELLADEPLHVPAVQAFTRFQPLGTVLAIMPWNFPFWQVFRFAAPALMAGNTALLKHAPNVPRCALAIEQIFLDAGFDEGIFQTLLVEAGKVEALIADERIAAVTLTGSERAGSAVASQAGRVIKKVVLELGGSDPFIIMPSADRQKAIETAVRSRVLNNGQSCIAAKRFIVHSAIYDSCERAIAAAMETLRIGDPKSSETEIGPLAGERFLHALEAQVERAVQAGAAIVTGGRRVASQLCTFSPTLLRHVPRASTIYREEFFGPVAMIFRAASVEHAIEIANDTPFGLGASVWTHDNEEADQFVNEIEAGQVFVNAMVASDARAPFGGIKRSGFGRELGRAGLLEFMNSKTIWKVESGN